MKKQTELLKQREEFLNSKAFEQVQQAFKRAAVVITKMFNDIRPGLRLALEIEVKKRKKYLKRVRNRQKLYEKRKRLGRR